MLLALLLTLSASLPDGGADEPPPNVVAPAGEPELHLAAPLPPPAPTPVPVPVAPPPPVPVAAPDAGEPPSSLSLHGAAEADLGLFPTGFPENGFDVLTTLHPVIGFGVGDDFGIEFGPTFRLRVIDTVLESNTQLIANPVAQQDNWKRTKIENLALPARLT